MERKHSADRIEMEVVSVFHGQCGSPEKAGSAARFTSPSRAGRTFDLEMAWETSGFDVQEQSPDGLKDPVRLQDPRTLGRVVVHEYSRASLSWLLRD